MAYDDFETETYLVGLAMATINREKKEMNRDVKCDICRDYVLIEIGGGRPELPATRVCDCEAALASIWNGKKRSLEYTLDKQEVKCGQCKSFIHEIMIEEINFIYNGQRMMAICKECYHDYQVFKKKTLARKAALDKAIEEKKEKEKALMKKPKISAEEMKRRYLERYANG